MPLSVRLPPRVEQELASYCEARKLTRSEAVKRAIEAMLHAPGDAASAWELGRGFIGSDPRAGEVARHSKRLLRERFRGGG
jgi:hypothetical protein